MGTKRVRRFERERGRCALQRGHHVDVHDHNGSHRTPAPSRTTPVVVWYSPRVAVEKLSISLDADLAGEVRSGAADDGVSISTWLAEAALAKARQRRLRAALDADVAELGELSEDEIDRLIADARSGSLMSKPKS